MHLFVDPCTYLEHIHMLSVQVPRQDSIGFSPRAEPTRQAQPLLYRWRGPKSFPVVDSLGLLQPNFQLYKRINY